jgi:signal transduction histidine kinase
MSRLISDVLAYSKIRREAPNLEPISLAEAATWALENLADGILASGGVVTVESLPMVWGDRLQLSQVFQNLIGNSIKYRSPDRDSAGDWIVKVQDNGIGIEDEQLEKIFRPFKRLHGYDIPGNGIGLAVCRRVIEALGGRIWAESCPGNGSAFFFTLQPAAAATQHRVSHAIQSKH